MLKNNYHTHMKYCNHAEGMVIDYVKEAVRLGFLELGMSDHAPVLESFMSKEEYLNNYGYDTMKLSDVEDYLNQIKECQRKFPNIKIYSGFETEYLEEQREFYLSLRKKVDYFNLGIHFFRDKNGHVLNCYTDLNYDNLDEYYLNAKKAIETKMYQAFVHPDLFMYGYKDKNGLPTFDEKCEEITRKIANLAMENNIYLEINTNGLKYCKDKHDLNTWLYPYPKFWEIMKEYNVKIIVGADAHTIAALSNENVELVYDFIKKLGINIEEKMAITNDFKC